MIAATLGHARLSTTALYAQVAPDMMRQGMDAMEALNRDALKRAAKGSAVAVSS